MPFKPYATDDDRPELNRPRKPWDEWGSLEQEQNLKEALGDSLFTYLEDFNGAVKPD